MLDHLFGDLSGDVLSESDYLADFARRFAIANNHATWKLERLQHFRQPGDLRWEAFIQGDWPESLRLLGDRRPNLERRYRDLTLRGITVYRVRVVEWPLTPYLHWELYSLRVAAESGERIRVVGLDAVRPFEKDGVLPELLTVGADTVYEIRYDASGVLDGAVRFVGEDVTARTVAFIEDLYEVGEDLVSYFGREVAPLPPPSPSGS